MLLHPLAFVQVGAHNIRRSAAFSPFPGIQASKENKTDESD